MISSFEEIAAAVVLVSLLAVACVKDIRERRIPNSLIAIILVSGLLVASILDLIGEGLLSALGGVLVGLVIWLPGWLMRMMGAGDVKLFAAAGAWLGPAGTVNAALAAAIVGGALAFIWMLRGRGRKQTTRTLLVATAAPRTLLDARNDRTNKRELIPYSLAMTAGVIAELIHPGLIVG